MKQHEEIVGLLKNIIKENDKFFLILEIEKKIETPSYCEEKIKKYIGKKIGIFLLDGTFYFRKIVGDKNAEDKK